jgi:F-type H+/Na+-transporting ATPase subunit alpha
MEQELDVILEMLRITAAASRFSVGCSEEGKVLSVGDGIVQIAGLRDAKMNELIELGSGSRGIVFDLHVDQIGIVLLSGGDRLKAGESAWKTDRIASIDAGEGLLGRVVDALGKPIDGGPPPQGLIPCQIDRIAPPLVARDYVSTPLSTGIKVIDAMLSIGRGQRELIIGDPSTGKTSLALDAVINQKNSDVIAIYTSIGQKKARILKVMDQIRAYGDMSRVVIVAAEAADSLGLQYLAPYSATAIAEYFLDRGRDVLIVYDDLTKHADAYRSLSLLLKRPPGREAYPGDIFFIHSRLLERSARLNEKYGGGSITALPIVETQQGRIASYIPTNLISITDGQIYLDSALFNKGIRPAVDVARSVSRIGGKAQAEAMRLVAERLKIDYSRFLEVEVFTRFGARVEEETVKLIRRGERMRELLKQPRFKPVSFEDQVLGIMILEAGGADQCEPGTVANRCNELLDAIREKFPEIVSRLGSEGRIGEEETKRLASFIAEEGAV